MQKKPSTMKEVAQEAGVAMSTVSHVINGTASVSPDTKEKVLLAIQKLNYTPNALARSLRQSQTKMIGIVVPDIANEFYASCVSGFLNAADQIDSSIFISHTGYQLKREEIQVKALIERRVDGLVFVGGYDDTILQLAKKSNVAVVLGDRFHPEFSSVEFDNLTPISLLIEQLAKHGITRVGYISEPLLMTNVKKRYDAFMVSMKKHKLPIRKDWIILDEKLQTDKVKQAQTVSREWLSRQQEKEIPQVFLTSSDLIAIGAIETFQKRGFRVPEDIGFAGMDNSLSSRYFSPPLTTIEQDSILLGERCFHLLQGKMQAGKQEQKQVLRERLPCPLVFRESIFPLLTSPP